MNHKTLIKKGRVHDGEKFLGEFDILINQDKILDIGIFNDVVADKMIDAKGFVVSPGFIDVQNMTYQLSNLESNEGVNLTSQGITSVVIGNCGNSGVLEDEKTFIKRLELLRNIKLGINVGMLVGHNSLRKFILGSGERSATQEETAQMSTIVEEALAAGALGLSSGLMYSPGLFAEQEELVLLTSIVRRYNKTYATHMRDEGNTLEEAVLEALDTAASSNSRLLISHLKVTGKQNRGKSIKCVSLIEQRRKTQEVFLDYYPYSATSTVLSIILPAEILSKINGDLKNLEFSVEDETIVEKTGKQNLCPNSWADIVVVTVTVPDIVGKSIFEISKEKNETPYQSIVKILNHDPNTRVVFHNIADEAELENFATLSYSMVATDGYVYRTDSLEATHPRNYGAFPRALNKFVIEKPIMTAEEFIRKATSLPAKVFNMQNRGRIEKDYYADLAIYELDQIQENATYEKPYLLSTGMKNVLVNGLEVLTENKFTNQFPGMLIE